MLNVKPDSPRDIVFGLRRKRGEKKEKKMKAKKKKKKGHFAEKCHNRGNVGPIVGDIIKSGYHLRGKHSAIKYSGTQS